MTICTQCKGEFEDEGVRDYNGNALCKRCAMLMIEDAIVGKTIRCTMPEVYHGMLADHYENYNGQ